MHLFFFAPFFFLRRNAIDESNEKAANKYQLQNSFLIAVSLRSSYHTVVLWKDSPIKGKTRAR